MFKNKPGFTIVELLIVIVVIAILAAISIVAYNGIQNRARIGQVSSELSQAAKKIALWQVDNPGLYPTSLSDAGVTDKDAIAFQYTSNNTVNPAIYCLTATYGSVIYRISSSSPQPQSGICSGYNLLVWNKQNNATVPVPTATIDTSVFRTSTASMRLGPSSPGQTFRTSPYDVSPGEMYTVRLWIRTDNNWNGTASNSKIRFGNLTAGNLATACSYEGIKSTWTEVVCSFTIPASGMSQMSISVGNDGSTGNIWIDDLSLSRA